MLVNGKSHTHTVTHADEFCVSKRGLNGTGTVGTAGTPHVWNCNPDDAIVLLAVHMAFNPRLDTNMAKFSIFVSD